MKIEIMRPRFRGALDCADLRPALQLRRILFPFRIAVRELRDMRTSQHGEAHQLLHDIDNPVIVGGRLHPTALEFIVGLATLDWFGIVTMRIHRPSSRSVFTALKLCEPPDTCMTASVRPCVGLTPPSASGKWSICAFIRPVIWPCRSGLHQTCPSDQIDSSRSSCTAGCLSPFS
jgi:hypothetical protein